MMSLEGPLLAAVIARMSNPEINLAAYGVAGSLAMIVESPVIMLMSAVIALVRNRATFDATFRFAAYINGGVTAAIVILSIPQVFSVVGTDLLQLPRDVAEATAQAMPWMILWPAAIGIRRFYQGAMIRQGRTRLVTQGTVVRLVTMAASAAVLYSLNILPGAVVGAIGLTVGVVFECIATVLMARTSVREIRSDTSEHSLSQTEIRSFYAPLALTSLLNLSIAPLLTFFMGKAALPVMSLAVWPVVSSVVFFFRTPGMAWQEAAIALMGPGARHIKALVRFTGTVGLGASAVLLLMAVTPASYVVMGPSVLGLTPELADYAAFCLLLLTAFPLLTMLISLQRAVLVVAKKSRSVGIATIAEIVAVILLMYTLTQGFGMVGLYAAGLSSLLGRLVGAVIIETIRRKALRELQSTEQATAA